MEPKLFYFERDFAPEFVVFSSFTIKREKVVEEAIIKVRGFVSCLKTKSVEYFAFHKQLHPPSFNALV